MTTNLPAPVQLSTLSREIGVLTEALSRPTEDDIVAGLNWLMDGGMTYPGTIAKDKAIEEYVKVLIGVPSCGLRKAMTKLKYGQYENINLEFIPKPASLAAMARAEAKTTIDDLTRLKEKHATIAGLSALPPPPDEGAKARVKNLLQNFRADHEAYKSARRGMPVTEVISPERAAMMSKIIDLPDRKDITAEQQAYRRRVASELKASGEQEAAE